MAVVWLLQPLQHCFGDNSPQGGGRTMGTPLGEGGVRMYL